MSEILAGDVALATRVREALRGLVYASEATAARVSVGMTLTPPDCPAAGSLVDDATHAVRAEVPGGAQVGVHLVWEPAWHPGRLGAEARRELGRG
ncbi:MAG TPA: iron-sulfur cluster assembly protein [Gammaproteobacteria bacterium]